MVARRIVQIIFAFTSLWPSMVGAQESTSERRSYSIGMLTDNYPYAYMPEDQGEPVGFCVELLQAISAISPLDLRVVVGNTPDIHGKFYAGEIDALLSYAYSDERAQRFQFSTPYLDMVGLVFARPEMAHFDSLEDLRGLRVVVHHNSIGERVLRDAGLGDSIVYGESVNDGLHQISERNADATMATLLSGASIIERDRLNLKPTRIAVPGYAVDYCFAAHKDNTELITSLNEALAVLHRNGEYEAIYQKWFGRLEPRRFSTVQVLLAVCGGLLVALVVAIVSALHQRRTRRELSSTYEALRQSQEHYYALFDATPVGLLVAVCEDTGPSPRLNLREANVAAAKLLGFTEHEPPLGDLAVTCPRFDTLWTAALEVRPNTSPKASDIEIAPGDEGSTSPIHLRWSAVRELSRILLVIEDITQQVHSARELRSAEQNLMQSQKLEALGNLSSGIAHDFNNVLTSIMGNTELLLFETKPDSNARELARNIQNGSRRARDLVRQILTFSRQSPPERKPIDLHAIVDETINLARAGIPKSISLRSQILKESATVLADATQIHQVLLNLITNGAQAIGDQPGEILVRLETKTVRARVGTASPFGLEPNHYHVIMVTDTGPGMSKEVMARACEPFFTTKQAQRGTGLGLSVAHGVVNQHGGLLQLHCEPGQGARVEVWLPASNETTHDLQLELTEVEAIADDNPDVLVIDDEDIAAKTIARMLSRLGCNPVVFNNPLEALEVYRVDPHRFRAVLCDLSMPECNGLTVLGEIRTTTPDIPTLLMTGFWANGSRDKARELGINVLTEKPISLAELNAHMSNLLGGPSNPTG